MNVEWELDDVAAMLREVYDTLVDDREMECPVEDYILRRLDQARARLERISLDISTGVLS